MKTIKKILIATAAIFLSTLLGCSMLDSSDETGGDESGVMTLTVPFSVSAVKSPAMYVFPVKQTMVNREATVIVRTKDLPSAFSMNLVISGAEVKSAVHKLADNSNVVLMHSGSTINIGIGPEHVPICGSIDLLEIVLRNTGASDTCSVEISECVVRDAGREDIALNTVRGCVLINN